MIAVWLLLKLPLRYTKENEYQGKMLTQNRFQLLCMGVTDSTIRAKVLLWIKMQFGDNTMRWFNIVQFNSKRDLCDKPEGVILICKGILSAKLVKESADICKTKSVRFLRFFRGLDTAVGDGNGKG